MRAVLRSVARGITRILVALRLERPALWMVDRLVAVRRRPGRGPALGRRRDRFQVLMYHRVNDEAHPYFPGTRIETFTREMEAVARYCAVLPMEELIARSTRGDLPPRAIGITFDDGYRDNYQNALPVLQRLGLPATIYLATGAIERRIALWHDRIFDAFRDTRASVLRFGGETWDLTDRPTRERALAAILQRVKRSAPEVREAEIAELRASLETEDPGACWDHILEWNEIRQMASQGISFGAHTVSHTIVTNLPPAEIEREVRESKEVIERELGREVSLFAYPNGAAGDFDDSTKEILRGAGYESAVTTVWGTNDAETDRFELGRVAIADSDPRVGILRLAADHLRG